LLVLRVLILLRLVNAPSPSPIQQRKWRRFNPGKVAPWEQFARQGTVSPDTHCVTICVWFVRWLVSNKNLPVPRLRGSGFSALPKSCYFMSIQGRHVYVNIFGCAWMYTGKKTFGMIKLSDIDPARVDQAEYIRDSTAKITFERQGTGNVAVANPQGSLPRSVAALISTSGAVDFGSKNLSILNSKDLVASNGGHNIARFCADSQYVQALNYLKSSGKKLIIDVGAKYAKTPSQLEKLGWRGHYVPVRLPGTNNDYDATYHHREEKRYTEKVGQENATVVCHPLVKGKVQDYRPCVKDISPSDIIYLINDAHYYLADWVLPYDAIVSGMAFSEVEGYYSMIGREGSIVVSEKDGYKHVAMNVRRNGTIYEHPLVRVTAAPMTYLSFGSVSPYRYCVWSLTAGSDVFRLVKATGVRHESDITLSIVGCNPQTRALPLTSEMLALHEIHGVKSWGPLPKGWDFATFRWQHEEKCQWSSWVTSRPIFNLLSVSMASAAFTSTLIIPPCSLRTILLCVYTLLSWKFGPKVRLRRMMAPDTRKMSFFSIVKVQRHWFVYLFHVLLLPTILLITIWLRTESHSRGLTPLRAAAALVY